jgi:hypothetical protein
MGAQIGVKRGTNLKRVERYRFPPSSGRKAGVYDVKLGDVEDVTGGLTGIRGDSPAETAAFAKTIVFPKKENRSRIGPKGRSMSRFQEYE